MFWKLFNIVFGWDYIRWQNSCSSGVARLRISKCCRLHYYEYPFEYPEFLTDPSAVIWLTCHPSKYFIRSALVNPATLANNAVNRG